MSSWKKKKLLVHKFTRKFSRRNGLCPLTSLTLGDREVCSFNILCQSDIGEEAGPWSLGTWEVGYCTDVSFPKLEPGVWNDLASVSMLSDLNLVPIL